MNAAQRTEAITSYQAEYKSLHADKYRKSPLAQYRGRRFEYLVRRVFEAWGLLESDDYYTSDNDSEQIDGTVDISGRFALMEAKWAESTQLAASELFAFIGKVEGKFVGTIGLFVSAVGLTDNFMQALRSGRRQSIMVIHGPDVDSLFDPNFPLPEYLKEHLKRLSLDNVFHVSAADFFSRYQGRQEGPLPQDGAGPVVQRIVEVSETPDANQLVAAYAEQFGVPERVEAVNRLVATYPHISRFKSVPAKAWKGHNLDAFIKELVGRLPEEQTTADVRYFVTSLAPNYRSTIYLQLLPTFASRFRWLQAANREVAERELVRQWEDLLGDWDAENELAVPTGQLWEWLSEDCKLRVLPYFFKIVMSMSRSPRFPQHRLAVRVLAGAENAPVVTTAFRAAAVAQAREYAANGYAGPEQLPELTTNLRSAFARLKRYVPEFDQVVEEVAQQAQAAPNAGNG